MSHTIVHGWRCQCGRAPGVRKVFRSDVTPTEDTHPEYGAVIGPFRTVRAARFMAQHGGAGNPHLVTVDDAERAVKGSS